MFSDPIEVLSLRSGLKVDTDTFQTAAVGDELWVFGRQWNTTVAARSFDGGSTWTEVSFGPPPANGVKHVQHLVRGADGRYVAIARLESSCRGGVEIEGGFSGYFTCTRRRPVVLVSDDGVSWTESAPAGLAPPGGSSLRINDLIVVDDGYLAAGTIEGPGWRAVLFSSPDGVTWTAEREFVGDGNPMTSRSLAYDGTTLAFTADETPCDGLNDNVGGWVLGAGWARHGRIFLGTDLASLTLQQPGEHPLAPQPLELEECGLVGDSGIPISFYPYPSFDAEVIGGTLTVVEQGRPLEQTARLDAALDADDDDVYDELALTIGTRRWAQLVDGEWTLTEVTGVNVPGTGRIGSTISNRFFEVAVGGRPASISLFSAGSPIHDVYTVTDDESPQVRSAAPLAYSRALGAIGVDDGYLLVGLVAADPFRPYQRDDAASVVVWRTAPGVGSPVDRCDLEPDGFCQFADLRDHPEYPDFSGRNLAGVDLTGTEIGEASFDGSNLTGARLWLVTSGRNPPPSFVGANLTDAQLQRSELGDISGAAVDGASFTDAEILRAEGVDFSNAAMFEVRLEDLTGVTLGDTDLSGARLSIRSADQMPDLAALTYDEIGIVVHFSVDEQLEIDLSGLDLTKVTFRGLLDRDILTVITSLEGAELADTRFSYVDLSRLDPEIDLSGVRISSESICPDGAPPEAFTCVREG